MRGNFNNNHKKQNIIVLKKLNKEETQDSIYAMKLFTLVKVTHAIRNCDLISFYLIVFFYSLKNWYHILFRF